MKGVFIMVVEGKLIGFKKFKSKKGNDLIGFTILDQTAVNAVGTCCTTFLGNVSDYPDINDLLDHVCDFDVNNGFASKWHQKVK